MASRAIRKHRNNVQDFDTQDSDEAKDGSTDDEVGVSKQQNLFDMLDDEDQQEVLDDQNSEAENEQDQDISLQPINSTQSLLKQNNQKQSAKNKKKKKSSKGQQKQEVKQDNEDIDYLVKQLQEQNLQVPDSSQQKKLERYDVLKVDLKFLNPENELRQIFGASTIQKVDREVAGSSQNPQVRGMGNMRGRKATTRKSLFVSPRETWPRFSGGLSMELKGTGQNEDELVFVYKYSKEYKTLSSRLNDFAGNIQELQQNLVYNFNKNPYHPEIGLQLYEMCMMANNAEPEFSEDVLLRTLYGLEMAWHPRFAISSGKCRLEYKEEDNQPFFHVTFRFIQNLIRRSCHRTALECCKLLLQLDIDDPMGVIFLVDYLALRSNQDQYLEGLQQNFPTQDLIHFPNFNYAWAYIQAKKLNNIQDKRLQMESEDYNAVERLCDQRMFQAICVFPSVIPKLIKRLNTQGYAREGQWKSIIEHKTFSKPEDSKNATLEHLSDIYVERSHALWKAQFPLRKLLINCQKVIQQSEENTIEYKQYQIMRSDAWPDSKENEYSELHVQDYGDQIYIPEEEIEPQDEHMGLGQANFNNLFERIQTQLRDVRDVRDGRDRNTFTTFLENLLPWVVVQDQTQIQQQQEDSQNAQENNPNNNNNNNNSNSNDNNNDNGGTQNDNTQHQQ